MTYITCQMNKPGFDVYVKGVLIASGVTYRKACKLAQQAYAIRNEAR